MNDELWIELCRDCDTVAENGPCPTCGSEGETRLVQVVPAAEVERLRAALEHIGQAVGGKANGADARAMAKYAREVLVRERRDTA